MAKWLESERKKCVHKSGARPSCSLASLSCTLSFSCSRAVQPSHHQPYLGINHRNLYIEKKTCRSAHMKGPSQTEERKQNAVCVYLSFQTFYTPQCTLHILRSASVTCVISMLHMLKHLWKEKYRQKCKETYSLETSQKGSKEKLLSCSYCDIDGRWRYPRSHIHANRYQLLSLLFKKIFNNNMKECRNLHLKKGFCNGRRDFVTENG